MAVEYYDFGPHKIHHSSVFYTSNLSFAFVNLRPAVTVKRVADLTDDETIDLWRIAKKLGRQLESYHKASSLSFGIQMNEKEKELNRALKVDVERKDRSIEEMALEADEYRKFVF
ncbi:hypothetical protein JHK82_049402 [Glycine max]|nr:hypothetical protein JHK87_049058 [Glycine soja]KAG4935106.1 hypothetical protein JHK85_050025 [Glycine max]KAG5090624.1 hypothetical protein JHK82_049402 [Glycine max]